MSIVEPRFKDGIDCPCGCGAFGVPNPKTGHPRKCVDTCPTCSRPRGAPKRKPIPQQVRRQVAVRSEGRCEHDGCGAIAVHMHHVRRRSQGGKDTVSNIKHLCLWSHTWVHDNPEAAAELGLLELREPVSSAVVKVERR